MVFTNECISKCFRHKCLSAGYYCCLPTDFEQFIHIHFSDTCQHVSGEVFFDVYFAKDCNDFAGFAKYSQT